MISRRSFVTLTGALLAAQSPLLRAQGFDPQGKFEPVRPPQPTDTPGKVEVVEVFWYGCPHCFTFLPEMERFEASKPDYVALRRMPAIFRDSWAVHARAFYTAQVLGVVEKIHRPLFEAIHVDKRSMSTQQSLRTLFAKFGVAESDFDKTFESFAVESLLRKSTVMQGRYGVRGTPSVIINGKYRTSGSLAGGYDAVIQVIEALASLEHKEATAAN